ncbi:MAG: energy-coupling factor ABC transporter permease [Gammaproteobacteria bacterium]
MDLLAADMSRDSAWLTLAIYAFILVLAVATTQWSKLRESADSNIFLATCAAIFLAWGLRASVNPGLHLHFLGASILALMFGWHFAIIGGFLVLVGMVFWGHIDWLSLGANGLLMSVIPASVTYCIFLLAEWKLPENFFIYIFVSAFLGGILSMLAVAGATSWFLHHAGDVDWGTLSRGFIQFNMLMAFPEGFTTGLLISVFVVYRPEWVYTFRDSKYLKGK